MKPVQALATLALCAAFAAQAMPGATGTAPSQHGGAPAATVKKLPKATGPDARTVEEVVKGKAALKDKPVLVNAQVVKVNNDMARTGSTCRTDPARRPTAPTTSSRPPRTG